MATVAATQRMLEAAAHVLVVGGGTSGVEFAAEVAEFLPSCKVTLVHSGATLVPLLKPAAQKKALAFLLKAGVTVLLNDTVKAEDGSTGACVSSDSRHLTSSLPPCPRPAAPAPVAPPPAP